MIFGDLPFPDIALHVMCSHSEGRHVTVMMDMTAHYAGLRESSGPELLRAKSASIKDQ